LDISGSTKNNNLSVKWWNVIDGTTAKPEGEPKIPTWRRIHFPHLTIKEEGAIVYIRFCDNLGHSLSLPMVKRFAAAKLLPSRGEVTTRLIVSSNEILVPLLRSVNTWTGRGQLQVILQLWKTFSRRFIFST
jgi:hypothetical protein